MQYAGRKSDEANEKAIKEGRAWRYKSQKTFNEAVKAGEIDATQNPWFTVGALEVDGSMAATDLTGKINAGWSAIVANSNDERGRDPEAFTQYYEQEVSKYVDTAEVDSHYWQNAFFKSVTSWHNQKASSELAGSRKRLFTHESTRGVALMGKHLIDYANGDTDALAEAQSLIEGLHARGMWNQVMKASVADRLNTLRQETEFPARADEFYKGLRTGPNGSAKLHEDEYFLNSEALKGKSIDANREMRNKDAFRQDRATLRERVRALSDVEYVQMRQEDDASWFVNELAVIREELESGYMTPDEWEAMTVSLGLAERGVSLLNSNEAKTAQEVQEAENLGVFYSRVNMLDDADYWMKKARDAGATGATVSAEADRLQKAEITALEAEMDEYIEFQDATNITQVKSMVRTARENILLDFDKVRQELVLRHGAQTSYNNALTTLISAPFDLSAGAAIGSQISLGARLAELFTPGTAFADQMALLKISESDFKKAVDNGQRDALLAAWGDEESLKKYAQSAGLSSNMNSAEIWTKLAERVVDMRGEDMPALRRALHQQMVQFFNGYDAISKDPDSLTEFFNKEVGTSAVRNLELAYALSRHSAGRQIGSQQHVFGDGNTFVNQYINDRKLRPLDAPEDIISTMISNGVTPQVYLPETQGAILSVQLQEKTDRSGLDGGGLDQSSPQGMFIFGHLSRVVGGKAQQLKGTSAGYDPVTGTHSLVSEALEPAVISDSGNLFMPDGGIGGFEQYELGNEKVWDERALERLGDFIIDQTFVYDSTSQEFGEQMGMLRNKAEDENNPEIYTNSYNAMRRLHGPNMDMLFLLGVDKANLVIMPLRDNATQKITEFMVRDATNIYKRIPSIPMNQDIIDSLMVDFRKNQERIRTENVQERIDR